jgi:exonuclease SbcC
MKLKKISLENIRSYENQDIEFPDGSVLLSGDIGSGKSTILLAVEFALFGLQRGRSGEGLLKNGKKEGLVRLNFEIDGKKVEIERRLKRAKDSVSQEKCKIKIGAKKNADAFLGSPKIPDFWDEEKELSTNEIKSKILSLLNYPQEFMTKNPILFRYTVYTPQEEMKNILLEDSELRLNTLRRVFDIDKYKRISENIEKINSKLGIEVRSKEGLILDLNSKKSELLQKEDELKKSKGDLAVLKMKHGDIEKILNERKSRVNGFENEIKELNRLKTELARKDSEIKEKQSTVKRNRDELEQLKKQTAVLEIELKDKISEDLEKISLSIKQKEKELKENESNFLEINRKIAMLDGEMNRNNKICEEIIKLKSCPTCQQTVPESHKKGISEKAESEIHKINSEIKDKTLIKDNLSFSIKILKDEISELREKDKDASLIKIKHSNLREKKARENLILENVISGEEKIKEIERNIIEINEKLNILKNSEKNYELAKNMLNEITEEERNLAVSKARAEKQIENIDYIIEDLNKEISEKEKIREKIAYFKKLRDWLSENFIPVIIEIEKNVMVKVHYEFSQLFGKWFSILAEGLSARINEEFTPVIEQNGYEINYEYLSGGERTAAALAYRLALNHTINSLMSNIKTRDLLILDEPTDGFSDEQLNKMRDVLQELKAEQLIIVSHEPKIEGFVNKIIRLEKNSGITRVN